MEQTELFLRFSTALVIGILIGLERERAIDPQDGVLFAGIRTFGLIGMLGAMAALAAQSMMCPWPFMSVALLFGGLLVVAYFINAWRNDAGLTTEVAALITFLAGALCYWGELALAAAIAVATALLLSFKLELHTFAHKISQEDIYASLKFAVITAVILPVLPDRSFGPPPFDVLNPYRIWLMVIFISGISFLGYLLMKVLNPKYGIGLTGVLGGLVSSTAVTLSFAQRSQHNSGLSRTFALAIVAAWTVMFLRVMVEVAVLNRALLQVVWLPMTLSAGVGVAYSGFLYFFQDSGEQEEIELSNPFELAPAIQFGLLYGIILFISRAAELYLDNTGLYISSIISGVADVDAITLSMAELSNQPQGIELSVASRAIVLAVMSNTCIKQGIVLMTGSSALRWALLPAFLLILIIGTGTTFLT